MWDMAKKQTKAAGIEWRNIKVKLGQLQPWGHNPRSSTKKQAARILESFNAFGQVQTVAVGPAFEVYDGHQRLSALLTMHGAGYEIDARQSARALSDDERRRLVIALHAGAQGVWDWDLLSSWDEALLKSAGMDDDLLEQMNRDATALRAMLEANDAGASDVDAEPQVDKADELREKWQTARGQVWQLDAHKLMCGDSTSADDVARLMAGEKADCVFTDPPYGVNYEGGLNEKKREKLAGDESGELYTRFLPITLQVCKPSAPLYIWFADRTGKPVYEAVERAGYKVRALIMWHKLKAHYGNFMAQYMQKHEPCLYCVKDTPAWFGPTNEVTVWEYDQPSANEHHPTQKPVELAVRAIKNSSEKNAVVADWFSGSGTTIIACEQLGRKCRAMEISEAYTAVALERWSQATGKTPVLLEAK
jgi:DNA modification methylase